MAIREGLADQLADDLWQIDTLFRGEEGVIASYLLTGPAGPALIDVGPTTTVDHLLAGVRAAGFDPRDFRHLVLTHVHLDHAGAAGTLARMLPGARVYVHRLGAPHLIDPTKLVSSARRIYGDQMETLWGPIEPVPAERLTILDDGDALRVGERTLRALYTPGHAVHHLAYHDAARAELFAGDTAGVRLQGNGFVRPPTPPPDLSLEDWNASLDKLEALSLRGMYLAHFGQFTDVGAHLEQLRRRLGAWGELMLAGMRRGADDTALAADLARTADGELAALGSSGRPNDEVRRYEVAANYLMSAQGYMRYYRKHHPERLA